MFLTCLEAHTFSPTTGEAETGKDSQRPQWVGGQHAFHIEFQDSQSFIVRPYVQKKKKKKR